MTKAKDIQTFWDVEIPICEVDLTEKKKIVVKRVAKGEKDYVDVRNTFQDKGGNWKFGKGIAIPLEHANDIAEIIKGATKQEVLPF